MKRKIGLLAYTGILTLLSAGTSFASHPLIGDDAGTLGKGTVQVELNGDVNYDKETGNTLTIKTTGAQLATTVGVGVTDKIDATFGLARPWGSGDTEGTYFNNAGSTDFSLNMKWQFYEEEGFSIALKPQLGYSYSVGITNDYSVSYCATLVLSKEVEPFAFHVNVGYTYNDHNLIEVRDAYRSNIWNFSLATTYEVIKDLKLVADFGAATNEDKTTCEMPVFGLGGLIYTVNKNLELSLGFKAGLTKPETDLTGTFGITLKL